MSAASDRPNVLLIVFDTARADAFEPYGAPPGSTPVVADLARRGTVFPLAMSTSNWTLPSHASMFTGLLPRAVGLRAENFGGGRLEPHLPGLMATHRERNLAEVFRRSGYATSGLSANVWVSRATGLSVGFERFAEVRDRRPPLGGGAENRLRWWRAHLDSGAEAARGLMRQRLDDRHGRPFFWFVNLMECHSPYFPPKPHNDLGPVQRWRAIDDVDRYQGWAAFYLVTLGKLPLDGDAVRRMRRMYARSIRLMDDWLGWLLGELDARRMLDDTLVVLTADHGENLGEDRRLGHVLSLDQRLLHVPLVMAGPGTPPSRPLVSLAELPGLTAEAAGLQGHPWEPPEEDLAFAQDERIQVPGPAQLARAEELGFTKEGIATFMRPMASVTDGRLKLVRYGTEEALYDLEADPHETSDVSALNIQRAARLRDALERAHAVEQPMAAVPASPEPPISAAQQREIEERLEQLGYL